MPKKHKFTKGPPIETTFAALREILNGQWIYQNHKILSPGWAINWPIAQIQKDVKWQHLFYAISTEETK